MTGILSGRSFFYSGSLFALVCIFMEEIVEEKKVLSGFCIVVADRGWIYVGQVEHDGNWCVITGARNIRRWGTSAGLGELAEDGPTSETKMDYYGTVRIPSSSVLSMIDAQAEKWK